MNAKHWYAAYTKPRTEKKTANLLAGSGVEVYLPMQKTLRQWSDRKKWVEMPLLRSYLFVKSDLSDYLDILNTPGVVRIIGFEGKPVAIPEYQIDIIKAIISEKIETDVIFDEIPAGSPVEITYGALKGLRGEVVRYGNKQKVIIRLDQISTSMFLKIPLCFVKKVLQK
jgi:transcriptional antiterminator RfaH